ncbi:MAG: hypothetical protein ABSC62_04140 [Terracidiphilus sp.]
MVKRPRTALRKQFHPQVTRCDLIEGDHTTAAGKIRCHGNYAVREVRFAALVCKEGPTHNIALLEHRVFAAKQSFENSGDGRPV